MSTPIDSTTNNTAPVDAVPATEQPLIAEQQRNQVKFENYAHIDPRPPLTARARSAGAIRANELPSLSTEEGADRLNKGPIKGFNVHYDEDGTAYINFAISGDYSEEQASQIREAFATWADMMNVEFRQVYYNSLQEGAIFVGMDKLKPGYGGQCSRDFHGIDGTIDNAYISMSDRYKESNFEIGSFAYTSVMHEIGHALGLEHTNDYDISDMSNITYENSAEFKEDTREYSIMSYFPAGSDGSTTSYNGSYAGTPMHFDAEAVSDVYGANTTVREGDTVYGFNSTADRAAYDFTQNTKPVVMLVDAGGQDVLDVSGFSDDQIIYLEEESFSSVGGLTRNVSIAKGTTIESAVTGAGNDSIKGNASDNTLTSGAGNDFVNGGDGADTFIDGLGDDVYTLGSLGALIPVPAGEPRPQLPPDIYQDKLVLSYNTQGSNGDDVVHDFREGDIVEFADLPAGHPVYIWADGKDTMMDYGSGTVRFTNTDPSTIQTSGQEVNFVYSAPPEGASTDDLYPSLIDLIRPSLTEETEGGSLNLDDITPL